ncbi:MAG: glycosyltransferase [Arcobacter sp.]|uniref:glycosyltransferase n=1 Tax=Arcobacter sp. TaxID=1872629 RepID=UPI003C71036A
MKISYVTMQFPAPSETFASNDIKVLQDLGVDISVYSLIAKDKNHNNLIISRGLEKIKIISGDIKKNIFGIFFIFKNIFLFFRLFLWIIKNDFSKPKHLIKMIALIPMSFYIFEKLKQEKPDILHLFWGHYPSLVGYLVKKKMSDTKLSMFLGAYDLEYALGVSKSVSKKTDFIFTHAKANLELLQNLGVDISKVIVVHRGTTVSKFLPLIESISKDKDKDTWLTVGRLLSSKGFDKVIDLFTKYKKTNPNAKLNIVGDGIFKSDLEKQIKSSNIQDSVNFLGHIEHIEVLKQMAKVNVFLLLSSKMGERLPNVLKEAMLAKCICISSDTHGIEELITHEKEGFIFKEKEYENILTIFNDLNSDEEEVIRNNARKKIVEKFDVEVSMKKYLEVWKGKK